MTTPQAKECLAKLPSPASVWKNFMTVIEVPRGSGNTAGIAHKLMEIGKELGCEVIRDQVGNVLLRKPPTQGYENTPSICLQSHMDMVPEKELGNLHDFLVNPILPRIVAGPDGRLKIMATGTSLGADNGIGIALSLALVEDNVPHGPLELLFTVDEETSMKGAQEIKPGFLKSKYLINVDSEEDWRICIGCAGGFETSIILPVTHADPETLTNYSGVAIELKKLCGGHSGVEIHRGRANAAKLVGRLIAQTKHVLEFPLLMGSLEAGTKKNVIPPRCVATVFTPHSCVDKLTEILKQQYKLIHREWNIIEPNMEIDFTVLPAVPQIPVLDQFCTRRFLDLLSAAPHGILRMSPSVEGLVESSINLCRVTIAPEGRAVFDFFARSSDNHHMPVIHEELSSIARLAGAHISVIKALFPGWLPVTTSRILTCAKTAFRAVNGKEPELYAIHAGLECGLFQALDKYPDLECISIGPYLTDVHSPQESLYIDTVPRTYNLLAAILRDFK